MGLKIKRIFLLISLILLQSCSGGRIGNFLESSFKNVEEPKIKNENENKLKNKIFKNSEGNDEKKENIKEPEIKNENENKLKNKIFKNSEGNDEKNKNIEESTIKKDTKNSFKNKKLFKPEDKSKNNKKITKQNISLLKSQFQPQSYKIILILKDVDPKDPIEDLSTILRNSDVNFEIEKIERFFDSKNKSVKRN